MNSKQQAGFGLNSLIHALFAHAEAKRLKQELASDGQLGNVPLIDDPADIDEITKLPDRYRKNYSLVSLLGNSRFNANGQDWKLRRDLTQPYYLAAAKPVQREAVFDTYRQFFEISDPNPHSIQRALFAGSLSIFCRIFGIVPEVDRTIALLNRMRDILRQLQFYSWVAPLERERDEAQAESKAVIREFVAMLAADRQATAQLERFRSEAGAIAGFSPVEEFVMNFFAGVETTVATATWIMDRLAVNQEVQARVQKEISDGGETPLTECMINETMRYFPPIPFLTRQVEGEDVVLGSRRLDSGQLILVSVIGAHHHPDYWREPHIFDSRRAEFINDTFDRRAFIPFLTGPRMCGGARLGRMEITEAVRAMVPLFGFERSDNVVRFDYALALRPDLRGSLAVRRLQ